MRLIDADALIVSKDWANCTCPAQVINKAPTIDAEPVRHGVPRPHIVRFIVTNGNILEPTPVQEGWECPFCGESGVKNYCPGCGAKMD